MINPDRENMFIITKLDEGFNPLHAPTVHASSVPSPFGHYILGLFAVLPALILVGGLYMIFVWKGGEKK